MGMQINHLEETVLMMWFHPVWQAEEKYLGPGAGKGGEKRVARLQAAWCMREGKALSLL